MLTDIFAHRYEDQVLWQTLGDKESRLLSQARGLCNDVFPFFTAAGAKDPRSEKQWKRAHDALCREIGKQQLSIGGYYSTFTFNGNTSQSWIAFGVNQVCEAFITEAMPGVENADRWIKERLSLVELMFRYKEQQLNAEELALQTRTGLRAPAFVTASPAHTAVSISKSMHAGHVDELNERLRRSGAPLAYHNGYIQIAKDGLVHATIEQPFWLVVADAKWANVSTDMAEAVDRRDDGSRDPALYAAKALESTIKIICDDKGWTTGGENGAHAFIDHLGSAAHGHFIAAWERESLKAIFSNLRNPFGHGPGSKPMPTLAPFHVDWTIESCMSWIKSLIARL